MNGTNFGLVTRYYLALWTDFSPGDLACVLSEEVMVTFDGMLIPGKGAVLRFFIRCHFERVDFETTKVLNFTLRAMDDAIVASYQLQRQTDINETVKWREEFVFKGNLIHSITRVRE